MLEWIKQGTAGRAILAWLAAWLVVTLPLSAPVGISVMMSVATYDSPQILTGLQLALLIAAYTLGLTAIPSIVLVHLVRLFGWRRGVADAAVPAGILFAITTLLATGDGDQAVGWPPFVMASLAAAAGLTYWLLAGRPRPPY